MSPKLFPFALNVGTDIVHLPRIRQLVTRKEGRYLLPFTRRILHQRERDNLSQKYPNVCQASVTTHPHLDSLVRWLGGRFAAKEAARKALGASFVSWKEVRVETLNGGQPRIIYSSRAQGDSLEEEEAKVSISHDGDYVVATVLASTSPKR